MSNYLCTTVQRDCYQLI